MVSELHLLPDAVGFDHARNGERRRMIFEFVVKLNRSLTHSNPIIGSFIPRPESSPDAARARERNVQPQAQELSCPSIR